MIAASDIDILSRRPLSAVCPVQIMVTHASSLTTEPLNQGYWCGSLPEILQYRVYIISLKDGDLLKHSQCIGSISQRRYRAPTNHPSEINPKPDSQ